MFGAVGAVGAVYTLRAMDRDAVQTTIRTTLITGAVLGGIMAAYRLASVGFDGNVTAATTAALISLATYLPVVFVMEDVLFRGLLEPYVHGSTPGLDHVLTIPHLIVVHTVLGYFLVTSWRRTGNLAAPGIAHAVIDALRNAVAVLVDDRAPCRISRWQRTSGRSGRHATGMPGLAMGRRWARRRSSR
jgi:hypothetical protein